MPIKFFLLEPSAPPANITRVSVSLSTVTITWAPPPPESRNGNITQYTVRCWKQSAAGEDSSVTRVTANHTANQTSGEI